MASELQRNEQVGQAVAIARQMLEGAALSLGQLPPTAAGGRWVAVLGGILGGIERLGASEIDDHAFLEQLGTAAAETDELCAQLRAEPDVEQAAQLARRLDSVARQLGECRAQGISVLVSHQTDGAPVRSQDRAAPPADDFRASVGTAHLQRIARRPIGLQIESAAAPQADEADEPAEDAPEAPTSPDGAQEAKPASTSAQHAVDDGTLAAAELRHCEWLARDCLSDLAALGNLRAPLDEMVWSVPESFEERLLANLDALLALALPFSSDPPRRFDLFEFVQRHATDTPTPDLGRQFARALALCSVTGEDAVRAALLAARQAPPTTYPAFRDALSLAPHPAIGPLLTRMLAAGGEPKWLATALEVLRFRREVTFASILPLTAHPDSAVLCAAARGLGHVAEVGPAIEALNRLAEEEEDDELVVAEAATSLALLGSLQGLALARARLLDAEALSDRARAGFLRVVALGGDGADRALVEGAITPTVRDVELVGWYGNCELVPWLLGVLSRAAEQAAPWRPQVHPLERAAAHALLRITGADLHDEPDDSVAYEFADEPSLRAEVWSRYWQEEGPSFVAGHKLRHGQPFSPQATLTELAGRAVTHARIDGALELALLHGRTPFEPTDWIPRQRSLLGALIPLVGSNPSYPPGRWPAQVLADRARSERRPLPPGGAAR